MLSGMPVFCQSYYQSYMYSCKKGFASPAASGPPMSFIIFANSSFAFSNSSLLKPIFSKSRSLLTPSSKDLNPASPFGSSSFQVTFFSSFKVNFLSNSFALSLSISSKSSSIINMDKIYSDIGRFEERLKMSGHRPMEDSDEERPERSETEILDEKN